MTQSRITAGGFPISPPTLTYELLREVLALRVLTKGTDVYFHMTKRLPLFHPATQGWWAVRFVDHTVYSWDPDPSLQSSPGMETDTRHLLRLFSAVLPVFSSSSGMCRHEGLHLISLMHRFPQAGQAQPHSK